MAGHAPDGARTKLSPRQYAVAEVAQTAAAKQLVVPEKKLNVKAPRDAGLLFDKNPYFMYLTKKPLHMGQQFESPVYPELDDPEKALARKLGEEQETYEEKYGPDRWHRRLAGVFIVIAIIAWILSQL